MKLAIRMPLLLSALIALAVPFRTAHAQDEITGFEPPPPPPEYDQEAVPPSAEPPPRAPDQRVFEQELSPYGRWVDMPEHGRVWIPGGVGPDWQPYADGRWVNTGWGWSFAAPVPWGWAAYHYGRWGWRGGFGWFWVPGYVWGPAWVSWRWMNGYACWSPLGPRGYVYGRGWPGWVVVPYAHFTHPIHRWAVPYAQSRFIVRSARPVRAFPPGHGHGFEGHGRGHFGHGGRR
jgi:hypothetical protein